MARYGEVAARVLRAYDRYEFQTVVHTLNNYLTVDLSAFYVDISKDRLYTFAPGADARRSAQTAIHTIVDGLTRLVAPILPITADELWRNLPGADAESVHLADFPSGIDALVDHELIARWTRLLSLRDAVNGELEKLRQNKVVGTSLEATVALTVDGELAQLLERYRDDLAMLFITSEVTLAAGPPAGDAADGTVYSEPAGTARIAARRVEAAKCPRCWRWVRPAAAAVNEPEADTDAEVCNRCRDALSESVSTLV